MTDLLHLLLIAEASLIAFATFRAFCPSIPRRRRRRAR